MNMKRLKFSHDWCSRYLQIYMMRSRMIRPRITLLSRCWPSPRIQTKIKAGFPIQFHYILLWIHKRNAFKCDKEFELQFTAENLNILFYFKLQKTSFNFFDVFLNANRWCQAFQSHWRDVIGWLLWNSLFWYWLLLGDGLFLKVNCHLKLL